MERCKSHLYGLMFKCPFKIEIENCPFKLLREMEIKDRILFIETLSINDGFELLSAHQSCLTIREKKIFLNHFTLS